MVKINFQNFPKRKNKEIRSIIKAPEGSLFVAFDYGQLEARVLASVSKDPVFCKALETDYDIHKEWAIRVATDNPSSAGVRNINELDEKGLENFRNIIKNSLVFPWFYGASKIGVIKSLGIPEHIGERIYTDFWRMFKVIKQWQKQLFKFYDTHGYVESPTGRRRRAPLGFNEIINFPIQSGSSDIVVNAMNRISRLSYELDKPQLQPILNIHDDLSFFLKIDTLEEDIEFIAEQMVCSPYQFTKNIRLEVDIEVGKNWADLENIGKFNTGDFR